MKKTIVIFLILLIFSCIVVCKSVFAEDIGIMVTNQSMYENLKGKIILKVEDAGKGYYVDPTNQTMYYLGKPSDAFRIMRERGIGITNQDIERFPFGSATLSGLDTDGDGLNDLLEDSVLSSKYHIDTDNDGYNDFEEMQTNQSPIYPNTVFPIDYTFADKHKGKIFLQVKRNGEAWYIYPNDTKRYYLGRPTDAFNIMRVLGLGISNNDFNQLYGSLIEYSLPEVNHELFSCQDIDSVDYTVDLKSTQWFNLAWTDIPFSAGYGQYTYKGWDDFERIEEHGINTSLLPLVIMPLDNFVVRNQWIGGTLTIGCSNGDSLEIAIPYFTDVKGEGFMDRNGTKFTTGFFVATDGSTYYDAQMMELASGF